MQVHPSTPVAQVDPAARALTTAAGERFSYVECLVATGASTVVPPVPGLAGPGVFVLRSFDDAVRLRGAVTAARVRAAAGAPPRALVLGASFAGVEIASVLPALGLDVVIVEREARCFRAWRTRRARRPWHGTCRSVDTTSGWGSS